MRLNSFAAAAAAVAVTTMIFLPASALANCVQYICVTGHDEGNIHIIDFSLSPKMNPANVTSYNFNDGHGQRQLGPHETQVRMTIPPGRPQILHYAFQTCFRRALAPQSACTPWENFTHTVAAPPPPYVAVAGDEKGRFELSTGYPNAEGATAAALKGCGAGCKLLFEHQAKCVALSSVPEGKPWAVAAGDDLGSAQIKAQQDCSKQAPGRCKGIQARCS